MSQEAAVFYPPGTVVSYKDNVAVVVKQDIEFAEVWIRVKTSLVRDSIWQDFWSLSLVSLSKLFPFTDPPPSIARDAHLIAAIPLSVTYGQV